MSKHIDLDFKDFPYPFLNKEFLYVDSMEVIANFTTTGRKLNDIPYGLQEDLSFNVNQFYNTFPRFDLESFYCKVKPGLMTRANPDFSNIPKRDYYDITDERAAQLKIAAEKYENVYVFWSGGIDSTTILCSLIKNWSTADLQKITIVAGSGSIAENPAMYKNYIEGKFKYLDINSFVTGETQFTHDAMYVDGSCANSLYSYGYIYDFNNKFPNTYLKPWRGNEKILLQYFSEGTKLIPSAFKKFNHLKSTMTKHGIEVETIFDFLWWKSFSLSSNFVLFEIMTHIAEKFNPDIDVERFFNETYFAWFDWRPYMEWSVSAIGTNLKINGPITSLKYISKKYIYDINHDLNYFENKTMRPSLPLTTGTKGGLNSLVGVDTDYNCYYIPNAFRNTVCSYVGPEFYAK